MAYENNKDTGRSKAGQKSSEGGRGDPEKASPAAIERYLKGIHYPASKEDLVNQAKQNSAPSDVMHVLNRFADKDYVSTIEVAKEVGRLSENDRG
jgi:hypothetical protein